MAFSFSELPQEIAGGAVDLTIIIAFAISVFLYVFYTINLSIRKASRLPPGPFSFPIIGNLHQFGNLPHRNLQDLAAKYGPIMFLRLGSFPTLVVSSPEVAKEVLTTHDLAFASRPASAAGKYLAYDHKSLALAPYGHYWRYFRKICVTELLSARRLECFRSIREEEVALAMRSIWDKSQHGTVSINVSKVLSSITSATVWRILSGTRYCEDDLAGEGREMRDMVHEVTYTIGSTIIGDFIPWLDWLDIQGNKRRMMKAHNFFDRVVQKIIDEHVKARRSSNMDNQRKKDIVDVLLDMNDDDVLAGDVKMSMDGIKATIFVLFIGGIETTATTLEWAMSALLQNPRVAKKLQQEIASAVGKHRIVSESDLTNMEYLRCVITETLRLYPAGPLLLPHESTEARTVCGYNTPEKTRLLVNVWAIGRDSMVWEDPLEFRPERFMGKNFDVTKGQEFNVLAFGAGRRGCPGAAMAMGMMMLVLAQMMHCFDWRVEGDPAGIDMTEAFGTSLHKRENLMAISSLKVPNCL
uniref:TSA: Wollemia nobilis Ref_Wollemi_Transcript_939_1808 transcribed RNA sequence n=1 Tax=Wollemia nobilis TaxID=56998 RepID=A0A0C9QXQ9_9CONI